MSNPLFRVHYTIIDPNKEPDKGSCQIEASNPEKARDSVMGTLTKPETSRLVKINKIKLIKEKK